MKGILHVDFLLLTMLILSSSCRNEESVHHTVFQLGYETHNGSTGPLDNAGFIFRINDSLAPVFLVKR